MDLGISGRVALVGGSSRGLGYAAAEELAREGARVVVCSRDADAVENAARRIAEATDSEPLAVTANLTDPEQLRGLIDRTVKHFGPVEILVNNTGGPPSGP